MTFINNSNTSRSTHCNPRRSGAALSVTARPGADGRLIPQRLVVEHTNTAAMISEQRAQTTNSTANLIGTYEYMSVTLVRLYWRPRETAAYATLKRTCLFNCTLLCFTENTLCEWRTGVCVKRIVWREIRNMHYQLYLDDGIFAFRYFPFGRSMDAVPLASFSLVFCRTRHKDLRCPWETAVHYFVPFEYLFSHFTFVSLKFKLEIIYAGRGNLFTCFVYTHLDLIFGSVLFRLSVGRSLRSKWDSSDSMWPINFKLNSDIKHTCTYADT